MTLLYVRVPEHEVLAQIAAELLDTGMAKERIHAYSIRPKRASSTPVPITRYRPPSGAMATGGAVGALTGALAGIPFLALGVLGIAPLLVLMVTGGLGGAVYRLWVGNGPGGELYRLDDVLLRGEAVMILEVDAQRVGEVERTIKSRHPDVFVLGADPGETPPFP